MISATRAIVTVPPRRPAKPVPVREIRREAESRAPAAPAPAADAASSHRIVHGMLAPFVAHVIATYQMWPQTRRHNRAEPGFAAAAYRAAARRSRG